MNKKKRRNPRQRQRYGYLIGLLVLVFGLAVLILPGNEKLSAAGPANVGHEGLDCSDCHEPAIGTSLQQLNANLRYYLNLRYTPVEFVHSEVDNSACLDCHNRPNDQHPTYRFLEPRFRVARQEIAPQFCASCHLEHNGVRVTQPDITFCATCHEDLELKNEPLDVSHAELAATERWDTCLACHDFHGNHAYETPTQMDDMFDVLTVMEYFKNGESPYGDDLIVPHNSTRSEK